jgi:23S rRNA pseudouridine2605 synthase
LRLSKYLASAGIASRRAAEQLIRSGRVSVGGAIVTDPAKDVGAEARVMMDGRAVGWTRGRVVYAVNKPLGVVSTANDPEGRPTVVALVSSDLRLYPVGRLDIDTSGLILLTNDGELSHRLTHPRFEVPKTYRAVVGNPPVRGRAVRALREGVQLDDGPTAAARVRRLTDETLEITIHEGRKRQVRRMCEHVGHPVKRLERVRFGNLPLGDLRPGEFRRLGPEEYRQLIPATAATADRRGGASSS